jgi:hypothetical protein
MRHGEVIVECLSELDWLVEVVEAAAQEESKEAL